MQTFCLLTYARSQGLSLTASLKAAQVSSDLQLIQSTVGTIVTRVLIQSALQRFYLGNSTYLLNLNLIVRGLDAVVDVLFCLNSFLLTSDPFSNTGTR
jgi:hypothetical protein